ncbi:hypothetical protein, partial [Escherichia coli]
SLKTSIKTITYLSDIGCLEIQGASLDFIRVMSVSEAYQDDHVPKGSEAEPLAELAYGLQVP